MSSLIILTAVYSGNLFGPKFDCVWAPETVSEVTHILRSNGNNTDVVLSGAMIWQFEAGFNTFLNISHPTEFLKKRYNNFETEFEKKRPQLIINDGYTLKKFGRDENFINKQVANYYELISNVKGSRYPVQIYKVLEEYDIDEEPLLEYARLR